MRAALEITEVMFDPVNDDVWKWIELRNPDATDVDLTGALAARLDDPELPDDTPFIDPNLASNTIIPAGGVAVLYDADLPGSTNADYLDQLFRDAWGLPLTVPLIGVRAFPDLTAGGTQGYWENLADYQQDLVSNGMGGMKVGSFDHAWFSIDYSSGFPAGDGMSSISWNGLDGSQGNQDGANWHLSTVAGGATTSVPVNTPGNDVANPGIAPAGPPPSDPNISILITEVMYDPAFSDLDWEWIEIYNNKGSPIDFSNTPYVLDDLDGGLLGSANVNSGAIPDGAVAVLYDSDLSPTQFPPAWDTYETRDIVFLPVSSFPGLGNSGDTIGLWPSYEAYADPNDLHNTDNAEASLTYGVGGDWPPDTEGASIYLESFDADPNDGGADWGLSEGDDAVGSFYISNVSVLHPGGDIGTPGTFVVEDADFDDDNDVDGSDFLIWQRGVSSGTTHAEGDANDDDQVNAVDLAIWEKQYGFASTVEDADFDGDDDVDGDDFLIWQRGFGSGTAHGEGDANDDHQVNAADLAIWETQYGAASPLQAAAGAVPEPATTGLALLALWLNLGLLRRPVADCAAKETHVRRRNAQNRGMAIARLSGKAHWRRRY